MEINYKQFSYLIDKRLNKAQTKNELLCYKL